MATLDIKKSHEVNYDERHVLTTSAKSIIYEKQRQVNILLLWFCEGQSEIELYTD